MDFTLKWFFFVALVLLEFEVRVEARGHGGRGGGGHGGIGGGGGCVGDKCIGTANLALYIMVPAVLSMVLTLIIYCCCYKKSPQEEPTNMARPQPVVATNLGMQPPTTHYGQLGYPEHQGAPPPTGFTVPTGSGYPLHAYPPALGPGYPTPVNTTSLGFQPNPGTVYPVNPEYPGTTQGNLPYPPTQF